MDMNIMTKESIRLRIDEDDGRVEVALVPDEFDRRVREWLPEGVIAQLPSSIEEITYWRGDLPPRRLWVDRLWWAAAFLAGLIFLYGLYALLQKVLL